MQAAVPPVGAAHRRPQPPQCAIDVFVSTSQPVSPIPSQSARPLGQFVTRHVPITHAGVPVGDAHARAHAPQFERLVLRLAQIPPGQSISLETHPLEQAPPEHMGVAPEQTRPHIPQLAAESKRASQPLASAMSQLPNPGRQGPSVHRPATHVAVAFMREHSTPQAPQWAMFELVSTQPPLHDSMPGAQTPVSTPVSTRTSSGPRTARSTRPPPTP
jgi:hypothetical protein